MKPRLLTGDTPTGKLHLGHWVGSLENRVAMQHDYECYFLLANMHAFTTRATQPEQIRQNVLDITLDYLAAGIDPKSSAICIQSEIPAIAELAFLFSMLVPYGRLMRNPTLKDEIRDKNLGESYPFGFLLYPIGQIADILSFRADVVPVGEDQLPHLELAHEVARRFDQLYCYVDPHTPEEDYVKAGGLFPIFKAKLGRTKRLVGLGGPGPHGQLYKMSKSLDNCIFLSDDNDAIRQKVMTMYTDPKRIHASDPGSIENNPLWIFHDTFNPDKDWVEEAKEKYQKGQIGDVVCKKKLIEVLVALLEPMHERRKAYQRDESALLAILEEGTQRAMKVTEETLALAKKAIHQNYFSRKVIKG